MNAEKTTNSKTQNSGQINTAVINGKKQKILVFGLGKFGRRLIRELVEDWEVIAVDIHESRIEECQKELPGVEYIHGAAESPLIWKKLELDSVKYIISCLHNVEIDIEVCRLAREVYHLKIPIMVIIYKETDEALFSPYHVSVIEPFGMGVLLVLKRISTNVSHAANVGLGEGELVEVVVKARSHLVDRTFRQLKPKGWHVSAIYRNEELILPQGNSKLKIGDRVLLVGKPAKLENIADILLKGDPQFPLQYGQEIVFPIHRSFDVSREEAKYWLDSFKAKRICYVPLDQEVSTDLRKEVRNEVDRYRIGTPVERFQQLFPVSPETGVTIVPLEFGFFKESRLKRAFKNSRKPFLLSRLKPPYKGVVVQLNGPDPGQAMETAIEIARLLNISLRCLYVTLPKEMRGQEEEERLRRRQNIIVEYEGIYKSTVQYSVLEGNPVRETLKYLEPLDQHLVVLVTDPNDSIVFYKPNAPYLIAKSTNLSVLVIPETVIDG